MYPAPAPALLPHRLQLRQPDPRLLSPDTRSKKTEFPLCPKNLPHCRLQIPAPGTATPGGRKRSIQSSRRPKNRPHPNQAALPARKPRLPGKERSKQSPAGPKIRPPGRPPPQIRQRTGPGNRGLPALPPIRLRQPKKIRPRVYARQVNTGPAVSPGAFRNRSGALREFFRGSADYSVTPSFQITISWKLRFSETVLAPEAMAMSLSSSSCARSSKLLPSTIAPALKSIQLPPLRR